MRLQRSGIVGDFDLRVTADPGGAVPRAERFMAALVAPAAGAAAIRLAGRGRGNHRDLLPVDGHDRARVAADRRSRDACGGRLDAVAQRALAGYPAPNAAVGPFFRNNFFIHSPEENQANGMIAKIDHTLKERHRAGLDAKQSRAGVVRCVQSPRRLARAGSTVMLRAPRLRRLTGLAFCL